MFTTVVALVLSSTGVAASTPEIHLSYAIEARLTPETRVIDGAETIRWTSQAGDPVEETYLHMYLNAFSHPETTWMKGGALRDMSNQRLADVFEEPWGSVEVVTITQDGDPCQTEWVAPDDGNPYDRTLLHVQLAHPVQPGEELTLVIDFESKLPLPFARTGMIDDYAHAGQWFPKLVVYEPGRGWVAEQFHAPTEFYADFANYDVHIETPAEYAVVATGEQTGSSTTDDGWKRVHFEQGAVHDFAFVAGKNLHIETRTVDPGSDKPPIELTYVTPEYASGDVERMHAAATATFTEMARRVGQYPFTTMTVVEPPFKALQTGGMEYPTLVTGAPGDPLLQLPVIRDARIIELVVAHEINHNYFQGVVANNERQQAFLDEGFTSFWEAQVLQAMSTGDDWSRMLGYPMRPLEGDRVGMIGDDLHEPLVKRPFWLSYEGTVGVQAYARPTLVLSTVERRWGDEEIDRIFSIYFSRWRFRHPTSDDFFAVVDDVANPDAAAFLHEAFLQPAPPDYRVARATSEVWEKPDGILLDPFEDPVAVLGDDPDGNVRVQVYDPGYVTATDRHDGHVVHLVLEPEYVESDEGDDKEEKSGKEDDKEDEPTLYETDIVLRGPGWAHLPVTVEMEFEDGAVLREVWQGRSTWRRYRIYRESRLARVEIDPEQELVIDPNPFNNGKRMKPDESVGASLATWMARVAEWAALGVSWWL